MCRVCHSVFWWRIVAEQATNSNDHFGTAVAFILLGVCGGLSLDIAAKKLLEDYPIEQYIRDAKIDTLYEGTTGIQAMDLFFRKIAKDQGQTLTRLAGEITELVKGGGTFDPMSRERALLGTALEESQAQLGVMVRHLMASQAESQEIYKVGFHTNSLLETLSEIMIAYLLIRQAEVASQKMQTAQGEELAWLEGKVEAVRFFCQDALPKARLRRETAELEGGELMELPLEAF